MRRGLISLCTSTCRMKHLFSEHPSTLPKFFCYAIANWFVTIQGNFKLPNVFLKNKWATKNKSYWRELRAAYAVDPVERHIVQWRFKLWYITRRWKQISFKILTLWFKDACRDRLHHYLESISSSFFLIFHIICVHNLFLFW